MSEEEWSKRRPMMCKAPWSQLTIGPTGDLKTCSVVKVNSTNAFIDQYASLENFYNSKTLTDVRDSLLEGKFHPYCRTCEKNRNAGLPAHLDNSHFINLPWTDENFNADRKKILTLEYTPSNICHHACAYCGSFFSSKWFQYDKLAAETPGYEFRAGSGVCGESGRTNQQAPDKDVQKILDTLPSVQKLILKGGEPFADPTNTKILQEILDKGYKMTILIVSSWAKVSDEIWEIIKDLVTSKNVRLITLASIDGVGKTYEWIRDAYWDQTINNIKKYYQLTGEKIMVSSTVSLYTLGTLQETGEWLLNSELVNAITHQYVIIPPYATAEMVPQDLLANIVNKFITSPAFVDNPGFYERVERLQQMKHNATAQDLSNAMRWIEFINKMRGFSIFDHNEFLCQWAEKISKNCG